ncbi:MAG: transglutaminase domain-containing protein [Bacillota bacterium]|nr:transglutaminase domain-containing protein [Bacillota bacterium]
MVRYNEVMKKILIICLSLILSGCSSFSILKKEIQPQPEEPILPSNLNSDYHYNYYYGFLNNEEKNIYNIMYESVANYETKTSYPSVDYESFLRAQMAFNYDHPEYYWISEFECTTTFDQVTEVKYMNAFSPEELEECAQVAHNILYCVNQNWSTYDKIRYIYEYIIETTDYNLQANYNQDIRSVLLYQSSVCAGYSRTFQYLCNLLEIPCIYVTGTGKDGESHSWNQVQIDGNWYWVDVTWGDPVYENESGMGNVMNYNYLCVSDKDFLDTHVINTGFSLSNYSCSDIYVYPSCTDDSYNYYVLEGCYFDYYDRYEVEAYFANLLKNGYIRSIELKFSNRDSFLEAYYDLFDDGDSDGYIFEIIKKYCNVSRSMKYELHYSESMYYICVDIYVN